MRFKFILAEQKIFPIPLMCKVLQVSRSGFYAWQKRDPSPLQKANEKLASRIQIIFNTHKQNYGSPRIHEELKEEGFAIGRKRIARIMREQGLLAVPPRRFQRTTDSKHSLPVAANVLERNFTVQVPNAVWATDITYIRTWEGWLYLAVVLDLYSRRVIGWAMAPHMRTELVLTALEQALGQRLPGKDLMHHSDRGSQYASEEYKKALTDNGIICSMSRKGNCWDNAVVESFFGTLKTELIYRQSWPTRQAVRDAVVAYFCYYNRHRRHSTLGYVSPMKYEELRAKKIA